MSMTPQSQCKPREYSAAFEFCRGVGTTLTVLAVVWIARHGFPVPAAALLIDSATPTAFVARTALGASWLLVGVVMCLVVRLWLGQAPCDADLVALDHHRSQPWVRPGMDHAPSRHFVPFAGLSRCSL